MHTLVHCVHSPAFHWPPSVLSWFSPMDASSLGLAPCRQVTRVGLCYVGSAVKISLHLVWRLAMVRPPLWGLNNGPHVEHAPQVQNGAQGNVDVVEEIHPMHNTSKLDPLVKEYRKLQQNLEDLVDDVKFRKLHGKPIKPKQVNSATQHFLAESFCQHSVSMSWQHGPPLEVSRVQSGRAEVAFNAESVPCL